MIYKLGTTLPHILSHNLTPHHPRAFEDIAAYLSKCRSPHSVVVTLFWIGNYLEEHSCWWISNMYNGWRAVLPRTVLQPASWRTVWLEDCPLEDSPTGGLEDCPTGGLSHWRNQSSCPPAKWRPWRTVLVEDCPGGGLSW